MIWGTAEEETISDRRSHRHASSTDRSGSESPVARRARWASDRHKESKSPQGNVETHTSSMSSICADTLARTISSVIIRETVSTMLPITLLLAPSRLAKRRSTGRSPPTTSESIRYLDDANPRHQLLLLQPDTHTLEKPFQ